MSEQERPAEKHTEPAPPVDVPDAIRERVRAKASLVRCPFCHDDVRVGEQRWVACAGCLARHHAGCWGEAGRCSACGDAAALAGGRPSRLREALFALAVVGVLVGIGLVLAGLQALRLEIVADRELRRVEAAPAPPPAPYLGETPVIAAVRVAALGGDAGAAHDLGVALLEGKDVAPNRAEGLRWLERSADAGDVRGMRALAAVMTDDPAQAAFWARRALSVEFDVACAQGLVRTLGQDHPEAKALLAKLAAADDPEALMLAEQTARAVEVLRERAARGDAGARRALYQLVAFGEHRWEFAGWVGHPGGRIERRPDEATALLEAWASEGDAWAKAQSGESQGGTGIITFDDD